MFHTRNSSQHEAEFVLLDQLVEEDHLLRKIDQYIDCHTSSEARLGVWEAFFIQSHPSSLR
ncbi:hypothetical protein [Bacillus altitudinis]|uniref:hypothetical protein n=1 Tax=Bacillus altitudinis TaxID=293387 RepID=UPI0012F1528D|nr:hypothetical protein [Bacillus altitudinis]VXB50083.1 hypothetical protein BACI9J_140129 [Bacillus altitudinis]